MSYTSDIMFSGMGQSRQAMNDQQLRQVAPSIFAEAPHADVSERYAFIQTIAVINGLRDAGWFPVDAKQTKVLNKSNTDFTKHMVRFQHPDIEPVGADGVFPEILMTNSHDRTSSFNFMAGLFRMVCSNGLCVSDATFGSVKVRHNSNAIDESINACFQVLDSVPEIVNNVEQFKQIELSPTERDIFARSALDFKHGVHGGQIEDKPEVIYGDAWKYQRAKHANPEANLAYIPVEPRQLLQPKRNSDRGESLWNTYNVIQENLVKGGKYSVSEKGRRGRTRGVSSISEDVKLNKALWSMAQYMADIKTGNVAA